MALFKVDKVTNMIWEIADSVDGIDVNIEVSYSGLDGVLEFEWATVFAESNPLLTEDQLREVNKTLECGLEETYVAELEKHYANTNIKFSPNHYQSVL